jgi:N-acetylmuramoyl-L-alanine amidase
LKSYTIYVKIISKETKILHIQTDGSDKNMKKYVALMLGFVMFGTNVYGQVTTNYIEDNFETTQDNYSISGSSDPDYPLYINGDEVERTNSGYFSYYANLKDGENKFVLENTSDSKTITINKKATEVNSDSASDEGSEDAFKKIDAVGVVNRNHPTVRSRPDEADDDLIGPYIKGTLVHIVAESEDYYETSNGAYLYTDSVDLTDKAYDDNKVKDVNASGSAVAIKMDRATEYKFDFTGDCLKLTLFDTEATDDAIAVSNSVVESIEKESSSPAVYNIKFNKKSNVVGYMGYYTDDTFTIELNEGTVIKDESLNGVKIILDAGHGGDDNGTAGLGEIHEKDIALSITKYLGEYLQSKGAEIVYTRPDDNFVALAERTSKIINEQPDISVSIHCNAMNAWQDFNNYSGTLNLYTYDTPSQFVEQLTEQLNASTYRKQNLALTRTTVCPTVLIETGFISNPTEYEYFSKTENQKEMAEKIGYAIEQYFYNRISDGEDSIIFSDISNHWAEKYITSAYEKGFINGYGDDTYQPSNSITRAEFIQILYNIFGNEEKGDVSFADVNGNEWYYNCISWAVANGLISGYSDNTFRAGKEISREEAAVILSRCIKSVTSSEEVSVAFKDNSDISAWASDSVDQISKAGIMQGDTNGYFNPKKTLTRAEMAVLADKIS